MIRRVVACSMAVFGLASMLLLGQYGFGVVSADDPPELRRLGPESITAGAPTFTLRLDGKNFADDARVLLDGVALDSSRASTKGKILLAEVDSAAVAAPGTHTVQAMNPDGMVSASFTLNVVPQEPDFNIRLQGNAAQEDLNFDVEVEVVGEGFSENSQAFVWGRGKMNTRFITKTRIAVQIPSSLTTEPARIPIYIRNKGDRFSNVDIFFIVPRPARLEAIEPVSVEVGTEDFELTVSGNFKPDAKVLVDGIEVEITRRKAESLFCKVPGALRASPRQLVVRIEQDGIQSDDETIAVVPSEEPYLFTIAPIRIRQGEIRETIDVVGANFTNQAKAFIDGAEAKVKNATRRHVTIVVTEELLANTGTHTIVVKDKDDKISNETTFEVVPDVTVSTLAGRAREGFNEQTCVPETEAMFRRPRRIAVGPDGLLYVTDQQNHVVRSINVNTGEVCTVAGMGEQGYVDSGDSPELKPAFSFPNGVAAAADGTLYVSDNGNSVIRRVRRGADGAVTIDTFAGANAPVEGLDRQKRINATRNGLSGFRDGSPSTAEFRLPDDLTIAPDGSIYLADPDNHSVRRLRPEGGAFVVETVAGNGVPGFADGEARNARFNTPIAIALSADGGFLFVADMNNSRIRRVNLVTRRVETFSGGGELGGFDGPPSEASFSLPIGLAIDSDGALYVSEFGGNRIRRVETTGDVSTVAGGGTVKFRDGPGLRATFKEPRGLAIDRAGGILYVADYENMRVRKIQLR